MHRMAEQSLGTQPAPPRVDGPYERDERGIYRLPTWVEHREHEYPSEAFDSLQAMQRDAF